MATYKIWIGTNTGSPLVGAVEGANKAEYREQIYPSQMAHRCVARDGEALLIVTPTDADERNLEIVSYFPKADGSQSSRR